MPFERILVAHDLSETSDEALRLAAEMSNRHGAALTILHVYGIPAIPMPEGYVVQGPAAVLEIQRTVEIALERLRKQALAMGARAVTIESRTGAPADAILEVARAGHYDLLVMGTHGRRGITRLILGSVAEATLRGAPCPVMTVHPAAQELEAQPRA